MSKKLVSLFMTIIIAISISVSASANFVDMGDISAAIPENEIPNTVDVTYEDGAIIIRGSIYQETSEGNTRIKYYIPVGEYSFSLIPYLGNGAAQANWRIELTNGDYIKGVTGTFYLWEDIFGPINRFIDSAAVDEYYQYDAMLGARQSMETFNLVGSDLEYDSAVIFEWDDFTIQGGADDYIIFDGNQQGKLEDFPLPD